MSILGTICFPWALLVQEVVFCTKSSGQKLSILVLPPTFCKQQQQQQQKTETKEETQKLTLVPLLQIHSGRGKVLIIKVN